MRILCVNAGSSSLKLSVIDDGDATAAEASLPAPSDPATPTALSAFLSRVGRIDAVAHRVVHGGPLLRDHAVIDARVRGALDAAAELAPLHVPPSLRLIDALARVLPVPAVACLDTAFHARMPAAASTYAVPASWRDWGLRRYGFHGLSCAWSLRDTARVLGRSARSLQLIVAHLGGGCSVTAIRHGHGVDTTMGFSPLDGLAMATRSGSVDPAAVLWLQQAHGFSADVISAALEQESGLVGLAGTPDMRVVLRRAHSGDSVAVLARDVFVHRVAAGVAAMTTSLDRVDALVFTGGVGEHAPEIREAVSAKLVLLRPALGSVRVVTAREDLEMADVARRLAGAVAGR